jgi:hypothetical protein
MLVIGINAKSNGSICIVTDGGNVLAESQLPTVRLGNYTTVDEKKLQQWLAQAFTQIDWHTVVDVQAYVGYPPLITCMPDLYRALLIGKVLGVLAAFPVSITQLETNDTAHEIALRGLNMLITNSEVVAHAG